MGRKRTSYEQIKTTPSSELRALELIPYLVRLDSLCPVIAIAGESGSGKSTTATSLQFALQKSGTNAAVLHLDNYFYEIPVINDEMRRKDFGRIGLPEIDIDRLQNAILAFKSGKESIRIPVLNQDRTKFIEIDFDLRGVGILIVEGTFAFELEQVDLKLFLDLDYEKSISRRIARGRDIIDAFSEKVLKREHSLIRPYAQQADILIGEDGTIRLQYE